MKVPASKNLLERLLFNICCVVTILWSVVVFFFRHTTPGPLSFVSRGASINRKNWLRYD